MYAQIITSSLTVGLGGSAGLESPIVVAGALLDQIIRSATELQGQDLIGCGVAAGIAAAFNALAGVLFAIEFYLSMSV
jgi:CIC family chloride channel protein